MRTSKVLPGLLAAILASSTVVSLQAQDSIPPAAPANSPLAKEPQTAEEYFDAALLVVQLARPDLAKYYLEKLNALNPEPVALLQLRDKFGMSSFLSLSRVEAIETPATELLNRVIAASKSRVNDSAYVNSLIDGLFASGRTRSQALLELKQLGPQAVNPILQRLIQPVAKDEGRLIHSLTELGEPIRSAIIGALTSSNPEVRSAAAKVLGWVGRKSDAVYLWHPAMAQDESAAVQDAGRAALARLLLGDESRTDRLTTYGSVRELLATAKEHFGDRYAWGEDVDSSGMVHLWTWDETTNSLQEHTVTPRLASVFMAQRLARAAAGLAPENEQAGILLLATLLANDIEQAGWSNPLPTGVGTAHSQAVAAGPEVCQKVLALALEESNVAAALGSVDALGRNGSSQLLATSRLKSSVMQQALDAADVRIQHAAAIAVLKWEPTKPFASANRIVEILARSLMGDTRPSSVVVDPNLDRAVITAGTFSELGYDTLIAGTGQQGFEEVATRGDVELAILDLNTIRWDLTQTVANLRADGRTANIPIVIYGPKDLRSRANHIVHTFDRVAYLDQAAAATDVSRQLTPILNSFSPPPLTPEQRAEQIGQAAFWLRRLAEGPGSALFDLSLAEESLSAAIGQQDPAVAENAIVALASIGRPTVQSRLLEVATAPALPIELKRTAALKLVSHIRRYGRLLDDSQVSKVSAATDAATDPVLQTTLSTVLGSLNPNREGVIRNLLRFPGPAAPPGASNAAVTPADAPSASNAVQ